MHYVEYLELQDVSSIKAGIKLGTFFHSGKLKPISSACESHESNKNIYVVACEFFSCKYANASIKVKNKVKVVSVYSIIDAEVSGYSLYFVTLDCPLGTPVSFTGRLSSASGKI